MKSLVVASLVHVLQLSHNSAINSVVSFEVANDVIETPEIHKFTGRIPVVSTQSHVIGLQDQPPNHHHLEAAPFSPRNFSLVLSPS